MVSIKGLVIVILLLQAFSAAAFSEVGADFLKAVRRGEDVTLAKQRLAEIPWRELAAKLDEDSKRLAFWLNCYNAIVQDELTHHPKKYAEKGAFFSAKLLHLRDLSLSLDDIEHGILRRSLSKYGLGYVGRFFVSDWERGLRLEKREPRIHFALNCGAQSCPAVYFYRPEKIDAQLESATKSFLQQDAKFSSATNEVTVSRIFLWFNGDFGGGVGIKDLINRHLEMGLNKRTNLVYRQYDWSLQVSKYADSTGQ